MSATYELLHFTPDHAEGEMILLGAVVRRSDGEPAYLEYKSPLASGLTASTAAAFRMCQDGLRTGNPEHRTPSSHVIRSPLREMSPGIADPIAWVTNAVLDHKVLDRTGAWVDRDAWMKERA